MNVVFLPSAIGMERAAINGAEMALDAAELCLVDHMEKARFELA